MRLRPLLLLNNDIPKFRYVYIDAVQMLGLKSTLMLLRKSTFSLILKYEKNFSCFTVIRCICTNIMIINFFLTSRRGELVDSLEKDSKYIKYSYFNFFFS